MLFHTRDPMLNQLTPLPVHTTELLFCKRHRICSQQLVKAVAVVMAKIKQVHQQDTKITNPPYSGGS